MSTNMSDELKQAENGICKLEAFHLPTTSTHSQQSETEFITTFFFYYRGFIHASTKCVVFKVRLSMCDIVRLTSPHFLLREKKESIRLGEKLIVPDGDADPARRNGMCLGPTYYIITVYHCCAHAAWLVASGANPQLLQFSSSVRVWKQLLIVV